MSNLDYDLEAMRKALEQCDKNIATFEAAIRQEEETKREYRRIIRELEARGDNGPAISQSSPSDRGGS